MVENWFLPSCFWSLNAYVLSKMSSKITYDNWIECIYEFKNPDFVFCTHAEISFVLLFTFKGIEASIFFLSNMQIIEVKMFSISNEPIDQIMR